MKLTWTGKPYIGPKKRPWWLDEHEELPNWLLGLLMTIMLGVMPFVCALFAATDHPILMMISFATVYPLAWFISRYGHDRAP